MKYLKHYKSFESFGNWSSIDELEDDVQARVQHVWDTVDTDTIDELTDYVGYHNEFLRLFGFGIDSVDYEQDVNPDVAISQLID